ncbi:hypothetical protein BH11BAC7_BH11BAC7_27120 [soil metagenome]
MNKKTIITLAFVVAQFFSKQVNAQVPPGLQQLLQDTLVSLQAASGYKGLSASVGYKNTGIWKSAVGESAPSIALTTDDLIGIGSNTKTFVSAMMLKLMEDGHVHLTDTIGTWIQGFPTINGQITIHQLLNHTSGLANYTDNTVFLDSLNVDINRIWTKPELLAYVSPPSFAPGSSWEYSNTNYIIASIIEEQIVGSPIHQIIRDSILYPLNLNHTFFPTYETATFPYAQVYTNLGAGYAFLNFPFSLNSAINGTGDIVSNAEDNTKFWQALFAGQIINRNTLNDSMLNCVIADPTIGIDYYGLGIMNAYYMGNALYSHGGDWIGQVNRNIVDTSNNIYVTVLSNQDSIDINSVMNTLYLVALNYSTTAIEESSPNSISLDVYPSPATTELYFTANKKMQSYFIYSTMGELINEGIITNTEINLSSLDPGIYMIVFKNDDGNTVAKKIIKQ